MARERRNSEGDNIMDLPQINSSSPPPTVRRREGRQTLSELIEDLIEIPNIPSETEIEPRIQDSPLPALPLKDVESLPNTDDEDSDKDIFVEVDALALDEKKVIEWDDFVNIKLQLWKRKEGKLSPDDQIVSVVERVCKDIGLDHLPSSIQEISTIPATLAQLELLKAYIIARTNYPEEPLKNKLVSGDYYNEGELP